MPNEAHEEKPFFISSAQPLSAVVIDNIAVCSRWWCVWCLMHDRSFSKIEIIIINQKWKVIGSALLQTRNLGKRREKKRKANRKRSRRNRIITNSRDNIESENHFAVETSRLPLSLSLCLSISFFVNWSDAIAIDSNTSKQCKRKRKEVKKKV